MKTLTIQMQVCPTCEGTGSGNGYGISGAGGGCGSCGTTGEVTPTKRMRLLSQVA